MLTKVDYFFIILFIISILIIVYLSVKNINKLFDNKIIVNICEDSKNKIKVQIINNNTESTDITSTNNKSIEEFIVADANDFQNYDKHKKEALKETNTFDNDRINHPLKKDSVDYDVDVDDTDFYIGAQYDFKPKKGTKINDKKNKKKYFSDIDFGWSPAREVVACANSSIAEKYKTGKKSLQSYQISCDKPNLLTAENYYKTEY
jgi:hypothetical protein